MHGPHGSEPTAELAGGRDAILLKDSDQVLQAFPAAGVPIGDDVVLRVEVCA
ncbi:hypothetical protein BZL29_7684 [Mycobacterium kansasii]|uniref:Uncharacterized protein n=1 Tax=Mycobacterium kansasii TaxID=1768 RepID=A0A1V3WGA4_MYCKA|nr:hypothetical protein BZL29_7684 [Mycobacterium kansasii]